jgi:murein DD-endopeptidase MepM/ murein hydrolase activator NlpD
VFFTNKKRNNKSFKRTFLSQYTFLYISKKTGKAHVFHVPGVFPYICIFLICVVVITALTMTVAFIKTQQSVVELEYLRDESLGLKSEVAALNSKIYHIQNTVDQVNYYSQKIKKVTTRSDERKYGKNFKEPTHSETSFQEHSGIGPLTKEEFEVANKVTGLKQESLELRSLFNLARASELKSSQQLNDLKKFLITAQKRALKIQNIPDLAPVRGRLTSIFGWRTSPFSKKGRMHFGIDIAAPQGSPIYATANGVISRVTRSDDYGKFLEILHDKKVMTRYAHTSIIYVKEKVKVKKGDIIAAVGNTGHSTGPHVHYEIEVEGKRFDPKNFIVIW